MCCKIHVQPKKCHHMKQAGVLLVASSRMSCPDLQKQLADTFQKELSSTKPEVIATERWEHVYTTSHRAAMVTFEKKAAKTNDSFEARHQDKESCSC